MASLAVRQHGVVTRCQLERIGLRSGAIGHRIDAGRLHRVHRGVYAVGHPLLMPEGRLMAAVLACGEGAVLSHRSAALLWDLRPSAATRVDVTIPSRAGRRPRAGIRIHRPRSLPDDEVTRHRGIPVTTVARTLLDFAAVAAESSLERAVDRSEELRVFDLGAVQAVLDAHPGRAGSAALTAALERRAPVAITRSGLEERFLAVCSAEGVPRPLVNERLGPYEVDFLWPDERLVVETDGRRHQGTSTAFEATANATLASPRPAIACSASPTAR